MNLTLATHTNEASALLRPPLQILQIKGVVQLTTSSWFQKVGAAEIDSTPRLLTQRNKK